MEKGFNLIRRSAHLHGSKLTTVASGVIDGSIGPASLEGEVRSAGPAS
jgi:hypothetical protein